jgi:protein gp37
MNMQGKDGIEWCDYTLNPVVGCTHGCYYCYARRMNNRFKWVDDFSKPQFFPGRLKQLNSTKPKKIFMDSMSDIAEWEPEWSRKIFKSIEQNPQHNYLFLTKNPCGLKGSFHTYCTPDKNIWVGVTVTSNNDLNRAFALTMETTNKTNRFMSIEPLVGDINISSELEFYQWVLIGQQTGPGAVPPKPEWVQSIIDQCKAARVPVFVKSPLYKQFPIQEWPEESK